MFRRLCWLVLVILLAPVVDAAQINSILLPDTPLKESAPRALRLAESSLLQPLAEMKAAEVEAADQLQAIALWNSSGAVPAKNGFARALPLPKSVRFTADLLSRQPAKFAGGALLAPPSGGLVWGMEAKVEGSYRLRLHLSNVHLPAGARIWVYSEDGDEEVSVRPEDVTSNGELWTPSVGGPVIRFEVRLPEGRVDGYGFSVDQILELVDLDAEGRPSTGPRQTKVDFTCAQDAACYDNSSVPVMNIYKKAVAQLHYVRNGQSYMCSGALMNDTDESSNIPYLLTAHHCFDTQTAASSLEAFFDYISDGCRGTRPGLNTLPRTLGATLLATDAGSDFTFVKLASLPLGRGLLGSTNEGLPDGTILHRLSHPMGASQGYSASTLTTTSLTCYGTARPSFLYSVRSLGAVFPGSSGAPVVRASDGRIVGQLLGACGPTAPSGEGCDSRNYTVDGALSATWPSIVQWLVPAPANTSQCTPSPTALCLGGNSRFKVEATFDTGTQHGQAQAVKLTPDTGYLWFFNESNVEAVVKVLDACTLNNRFWVFAGGLTNVNAVLTVTDTKTGTVKTYTNPQKTAFAPVQDTDAFATCQ